MKADIGKAGCDCLSFSGKRPGKERGRFFVLARVVFAANLDAGRVEVAT
jgi:hypothetical protein